MKNQIEKHFSLLNYTFEKEIPFSAQELEKAWDKLNKRETFVKAQVFPYKVEFDADSQSGNFETGELNIHHGPLLSVHGVIGDITENYRDLQYFYGSYVFSYRFIRPLRLEFFKTENIIKLKMNYLVHPTFYKFWDWANSYFWSRFKKTLK